jgi:membrane protease YdiL (CAAX protease family)
LLFCVILVLLWIPVAGPIYWLISLWAKSPAELSNTASILTLPVLYAEFIILVGVWGRWVYGQPGLIWRYGLEFSQRMGVDVLTGLGIGLTSLFALFLTESLCGWAIWKVPSILLLRVILEGLVVSLGIGFAEELLFRGWVLDELQRDYNLEFALWADALLFATLHFIRPLPEIIRTFPQFPGLVLLGVALVWAKRSRSGRWLSIRRDRLGLPIGLHAGLVWGYYIVNVWQLTEYTKRVPEWVTGIDRNPLSGAIGLLFLSGLALLMRYIAIQRLSISNR